MEEEEDDIDYSNIEFEDDDFLAPAVEPEWGDEQTTEIEIAPPAYIINNSIARHKHLCHILAVYYHAKHGESMADIFEHLQDTTFMTAEFHVSE
jgi:hypothetical protein